jgi:CBS domain-containing protein
MTPNPVSIMAMATVKQAAAFLTDNGFGAAPVIDMAGRPVGVLSRSDIVVHDRQGIPCAPGGPGRQERGEARPGKATWTDVVDSDLVQVCDIMTPVIFSVSPQTPAAKVVEKMLTQKIHRLFVVDGARVLIGIISGVDVLRHLEPA